MSAAAPEGFPVDAHGRAPLPEPRTHPRHGRVLVLAPHADDDVLGVGGTACLHAEQGDPVHVIVVFNGLRGDPEGRWDPEELRALRREEARRGGAHLGLESYEFWDYPEGHEPGPDQLAAAAVRIGERVRALQAEVVYAPWIGEYHLDHHVLSRATRLGLHHVGFEGTAWGFEVWTPLIPTLVIDVSAQHERKVRALSEHRSQLAYVDMVHMGLAMSAQRALYVSESCRHAEGFAPLGAPEAADRALV